MKYTFVVWSLIGMLFVAGCGTPNEEVTETVPRLKEYMYSLPDAYFAHYFPVGSASDAKLDESIAVFDEENGYIEFKTKETVSGTTHWAMKEFKMNNGKSILAISDMVQVYAVDQRFYLVRQESDTVWNDNTKELLEPVLAQVREMSFADVVRDHYPDDIEDSKIEHGAFVFGPEEAEITTGVVDVWDIELPLYTITWDGEAFSLKETE